MSEVARFVALVKAGVPLSKAEELSEVNVGANKEIEILIQDTKRLGAPISMVGNRIVNFEMDLIKFRSEVQQAMAVPLQTRKLLLWLPALSLVIGQLSGFGTVVALFTPLGLAAGVLAGALILLGINWTKRMLEPTRRPVEHPGFSLMRLGLAIHSGKPLGSIENQLLQESSELVSLAKRTGAPLSELIDGEIELRATQHQQKAMTEARQLSVKLLTPMGLTVLPAFFILTIVPMFLGIGFN